MNKLRNTKNPELCKLWTNETGQDDSQDEEKTKLYYFQDKVSKFKRNLHCTEITDAQMEIEA